MKCFSSRHSNELMHAEASFIAGPNAFFGRFCPGWFLRRSGQHSSTGKLDLWKLVGYRCLSWCGSFEFLSSQSTISTGTSPKVVFFVTQKSDAPQQTQTFESCSINSCAVCAVQLPPAYVQTALELVWNTHFQIVSMQHTTTSNPEWWKHIRAWLLTCSLQGGMIDYASVLESCVTSVQSNWLTPASLLQQPM